MLKEKQWFLMQSKSFLSSVDTVPFLAQECHPYTPNSGLGPGRGLALLWWPEGLEAGGCRGKTRHNKVVKLEDILAPRQQKLLPHHWPGPPLLSKAGKENLPVSSSSSLLSCCGGPLHTNSERVSSQSKAKLGIHVKSGNQEGRLKTRSFSLLNY